MARLGFLGLGIMGGQMALHLIEAGHEVAVWSYSAGKTDAFVAKGAVACATPAEVAKRSECVFLCVGDTEMSQKVILGKDGLAEGAVAGTIIVDCSTVAPSASKAIATELETKGIAFLDAPCTGSKAGAEGGTLTFMVGGPKEVFDKVRPWFQAMGKLLYYCGGPGMGLHAKLSQNMVLGSLLQAFNESMVLATKAGVDPEMMLDILNNSAARSGMISAKAPMLESAAELNVPVPVTALSQQMYRAAIAKGFGEDDMCGSIRLLEEIAGVTVKAKQ
jgi:3-hydroxyisobutyrate dehydrogenase/2-hydroxy-3-oxopropionate reductase